MVAVRSRLMAVWFTAMMLGSTLLAAPAATADHSTTHAITIEEFDVKTNANATITATVAPGGLNKVRFNLVANVPQCEPDPPLGSPVDVDGVTASVSTAGVLTVANPPPMVLQKDPTGTLWRASITVDVVANVGADADDQKIGVTVTAAACAATHSTPSGATGQTASSFAVDTKAPEWTGDSAAWFFHDLSFRAPVPGLGLGTGAIGSFARFNVSATDAAGILAKVQASALNGTTGFFQVTPGLQSIEVLEGGTGGYPSIDGSSINLNVEVVDGWGNSITRTITANIDNVRPNPTNFLASPSALLLSQERAAFEGDENNRIWPNFTDGSAPSQTVKYAEVTIRQSHAAGGGALLATVYSDEAALGAAKLFSIDGGAGNLGAFDINMSPVDAAGNVNTTIKVPLVFPRMEVAYGPSGSSPEAVGGTLLGSVYVNVTHDVAPLPWNNAETSVASSRLWAQLAREGVAGIGMWKSTTTNGTQEGDFIAESATTLDPSTTTTTVIRARTGYASDRDIILTNLSRAVNPARAFIDGSYQLIFRYTGESGNELIHVNRFKVDGVVPRVVGHPSYANAVGVVANTNMTGAGVIHGSDGNPFRVVSRVLDDRIVHDVGTTLDSGLRNVTFELFDPVTGQVVRRTSAADSLAQLDVRRGVASNSCSANYEVDVAKPLAQQPPLIYCVDISNWTVAQFNAPTTDGGCGGTPDTNRTCRAFKAIAIDSPAALSWTFINETTFSGWVNLTWPDLPLGSYKVRVSGWDFAALNNTKTYPTNADTYNVLPAVTISEEPRMTIANLLDVVPAASQRYSTAPGNVSSFCVNNGGTTSGVRDVCPTYATRVYVTNDPTNGSEYRVPGDRTYLTVDTTTYAETVGGFGGTRLANGTLVYAKDVPLRYFRYIANTQPNLTTVSGLNLTQDIYVRAEAVALDSALNEVTRKSDWIKVSSPTAAALSLITHTRDWQVNKTGDIIPLNITFDRKTSTEVPKVRYWVNSTAVKADGAPVISIENDSRMDPASHFGTITHWTTRIANASGAFSSTAPALDVGAYKIEVLVFVPGATPAQDQNLSHITRFFIVQDQPTITFLTPPPGSGIVEGPPRVASRAFDVPFRVDHGDANVTDVGQISYKLTSGTAEIAPGTTFTVATRADTGLSGSALFTDFTASVTIPADSIDNDPYQLAITVNLAGAGDNIVNATGFMNFRYDGKGPTVAFKPDLSEAQVYQLGSDPRKDLADERPAFIGTARDTGAGIKSVEVRIFDTTIGRTIRLVPGTAGYQTEVGLTDAWASDAIFDVSTGTTARFITLTALPNGDTQWTLPLNYRTTSVPGTALPDLWANGTGIINLSHKYQLDIRVTDKLDQATTISVADFDFDAAPPTLGVGTNALGTTANVKSGIVATSTVVNWHTVNGRTSVLRVNVTDNQCLVGVYLLARSDKEPSVTHQARMSPDGFAGDGRICYDAMPTQPNSNKYVTYVLDLRDAPENMTDHVTNYTYWWKAVDEAGQVSEVPADQRTFRMRVEDASPATVSSILLDPNPGQSGGRTLVRANVFDNQNVTRVTAAFHRGSSITAPIVGLANMTPENTTADGVGWWIVDTQDDMNLTLETGEYLVNITAFDINWNRTGSPTCLLFCVPYSTLYVVRDDGAPSTQVVSPANNATVNETPTFVLRALHKTLQTSGIVVRVSLDGTRENLTTVPSTQLNLTELTSGNGTRQGWTVIYTPSALEDNTSLLLNISATIGGLTAASDYTYRVDALPPTVSANVTGTTSRASRTWAVAATRVGLEAFDNVSATTILYTVNGAAQPSTYTGPITPSGDDGEWKLEYWARDAAGNLADRKNVTLHIDRLGPRIAVNGHGDEIVLTVTDAGVGVNDSTVTAHYRYGGATSFSTATATRIAGGNSFRALLPGNASETGLAYYFTAQDLLGNQGTNFSAVAPHTIPKTDGEVPPSPPTEENAPPTLSIDAPLAGQNVTGQIDIRWTAEDPEGAPLTVVIARINPDGILMAPAPDPGRFLLNLTGEAPGTYTIVVTASDGVSDVSEQVTFNVVARETIGLARALPRQVANGTAIPLEVTINPTGTTVARATYSLMRDGVPFVTGPLTRNAAGNYGALINANESGNYLVVVDVLYGNQTTESRTVGAIAVAGGASPTPPGDPAIPFPVSLMVLAAVAILVVPLAAYGAFGRWRK